MEHKLTDKQYKELITLAYLGDWVVNAHQTGKSRFRQTMSDLLSSAGEHGLGHWVNQDNKRGDWWPSSAMEDDLHEYIDDYDDNTFWEELTDRMAKRDMNRDIPPEQRNWNEPLEFFKAYAPYETIYDDEFQKHGIDNLAIVVRPDILSRNPFSPAHGKD